MIAKLLKELVQALWRYVSFPVTGPRAGSQEGALVTPMQMPAPGFAEESAPRLRDPPLAVAPRFMTPARHSVGRYSAGRISRPITQDSRSSCP